MQTSIYRLKVVVNFLRFSKIVNLLVFGCLTAGSAELAEAQRPRFYPQANPPASVASYQQPAMQQPVLPPNTTIPPMPSGNIGPQIGQPVVIQGPAFDPFATQVGQPQLGGVVVAPQQFPTQPIIQPGIYPGQPVLPQSGQLYNNGPYIPITPPGTSPIQQPYPNIGGGVYAPGTYFPPNYGAPGQFGTSGSWSNAPSAWPNQVWARLRSYGIDRLLERPRFRHTYIGSGSQITDLGIHDAEIATTLTIPNFLWTNQPLRVSPGFIFHFWDGPSFPAIFGILLNDMPAQAYSTYLAADYSTPWDRRVGGEINATVGLYTDFQHIDSDSFRITGVGLGWFRITPNTTLKFGVEYLDRIDIKLFPAGGLFIQPSPDLKMNLYFPRPKIAVRYPNVSNFEVWGYMGAEYGGGSWSLERNRGILPPFDDRVDINDIRFFVGVEWLGPRRVTGFFEGGYVFERELVFDRGALPNRTVPLSDSFMLRSGIAF